MVNFWLQFNFLLTTKFLLSVSVLFCPKEVLIHVGSFYGLSYLLWEGKNTGLCEFFRLFFGFLVISSTEVTDTGTQKHCRRIWIYPEILCLWLNCFFISPYSLLKTQLWVDGLWVYTSCHLCWSCATAELWEGIPILKYKRTVYISRIQHLLFIQC